MNALQHLNLLANQHKAANHPNFPAKYIPQSKYRDHDANSLTRCIVDYLNLSGYFCTRLASTGTYRADLQKFVHSQQRTGLPDVFGVVEGRAVFIEVRVGNDRLSDVQKQTITQLKQAGAWVYVAATFQDFYDWFKAEFLTPPF